MPEEFTPALRSPNSEEDSGRSESRPLNKRAAVRYELRAPAVFAWVDHAGMRQERRGYTRDISPKGAFVFSLACPPSGTSLEMSIFLSVASQHERDVRIDSVGSVVRVEAEQNGLARGFSVQNSWVTYARVE